MSDVEQQGKRLQDIRKEMEKEQKQLLKEQALLIGNGVLPKQFITDTKLRINNNLVLEARKDIIATALSIQNDNPDESQDAFWLINKIKPLNFVNRKDAKGRTRPATEIDRLLDRIKGDIQKLEQGQLKKGTKTIKKFTIDDFTLINWPATQDKVLPPVQPIHGPVKQFVFFQNFDLPPPSLKRKINPYKSKNAKYLKFETDKYTLEDPVVKTLRQVVFDRLFELLVKIKGYNVVPKKEVFVNEKAEYMKNKIKELIAEGQVQVLDDTMGMQMVNDFLANHDNNALLANIISFQFKRLNPQIYTKDSIVVGRKLVSVGLLPTLQYGRSSVIASDIIRFLEDNAGKLTDNYAAIKEYGLNPWATDKHGQPIFEGGLERSLYNLILEIVILRKDSWDADILRQFIVGDSQQRITNEQVDAIALEWDNNVAFNSAETPDDDLITLRSNFADEFEGWEGRDEEGVDKLKTSLRQQVDDLEINFYSGAVNAYRSAGSSEDVDGPSIRTYVLNVATLTSQLDDPLANDLRLRIQNGSLAVPSLAYLDKEELLPELFMNAELQEDATFSKWFNNQVYVEANLILQMWNSNVTDPFPIQLEPRIFEPNKFVVRDVCTTLSKFYVKTQNGIRCMNADEIRENIEFLRQYNRKDLLSMIQE